MSETLLARSEVQKELTWNAESVYDITCAAWES